MSDQAAPIPYPLYSDVGHSQQPIASTSSAASPTVVGAGTSANGNSQPQSRQAAEDARKDRTLAEFMVMLDEYEPLIPNEVTDYYLQKVGFECEDPRLKRLLSLAAQKFVSDIAGDAFQHARIRTNASSSGRSRANQASTSYASYPYGGAGAGGPGGLKDRTRTTLTMDDLSAALQEYGINARKPEYYL